MIEKAKTDLYQVLPPLSDEEYESLKEDIKERGVMVPVEIDEAGHILDGYHRVKACHELGITDFPTIVREGLTEDEKYEHALRLNVRRRHLSGEQLKEAIRDFKEKHPASSNRQIAKAVGVDDHTVAKMDDEFATAEFPQLQKTTGSDGKSHRLQKRRQNSRGRLFGMRLKMILMPIIIRSQMLWASATIPFKNSGRKWKPETMLQISTTVSVMVRFTMSLK